MKKKVTIQDIAEKCHVSAMTVSRAFRKDGRIKAETREQIIQCAAGMGYLKTAKQGRPNAVPQAEKAKRIQFIFGSLGKNPALFHTRLLTAMEQQLSQMGYECIIRSSTGNYQCFMSLLQAAGTCECYASVILGNFPDDHLAALLAALPGALVLDNSGIGVNDNLYSYFSFDNTKAAYLGVTHLIENGHRRILLIPGDPSHAFAEEVLEGYRKALKDAGLTFAPELVLHTDFTADGTAREFQKYLVDHGKQSIDAVFTNDEMATGIYKVLQVNDIAIPGEIAVCGCDNLPVGEQLYPELTTVRLDYDALASLAVEHIDQNPLVMEKVQLPPTLLIKKSSL